jgi:imidazolonepropionase-like amidohydrolase
MASKWQLMHTEQKELKELVKAGVDSIEHGTLMDKEELP